MKGRLERVAPLLGAVVWAVSVGALMLAMWAWTGADRLASWHGRGSAGMQARHLQRMGTVGVVGFAGLQVAALLVTAWALRVRFGMKAPASFAVSGAAMMAADAAGMMALLVWLRVAVGAG